MIKIKKKVTQKFYFLMAACLAVLNSNAQQNSSVYIKSLEQLWQIAKDSNAVQRTDALKKQQAEADYKAAKSYLYPQASAGFNGTDNFKLSTTPVPGELINEPGKTLNIQFGKQYTYNANVVLSQSLFNWQQQYQAKIAKEHIAFNSSAQQADEQILKTQLAQYYFSWQVAYASAKISEKDLQLADSIVVLTQQKFQQGSISALPVNKSVIDKNSVLQNIYQNKEMMQQAFTKIKILLGLSSDALISIQPVDDFETLYTQGLQGLGDDKTLLQYANNINVAALQLKSAKANTYPKLSAEQYFGFQQFRDNFGMSFGNDAWKNYNYLGLSLSVPIFTGFAIKNKIKSARIQLQIAGQQYQAAIYESKLNDEALQNSYSNYLGITASAKNSFELYGKNLQLTQQQFNEGIVSADNYLEAFENYLAAENIYLNNLCNLLFVQAAFSARN
ncbi:MAG: TolC family protein [Parafilimonas sp.]